MAKKKAATTNAKWDDERKEEIKSKQTKSERAERSGWNALEIEFSMAHYYEACENWKILFISLPILNCKLSEL